MPAPEHDAKSADAVERLYHYLDGELDDQRRALVKRHLDDCMPCLEAFDFELELRQVIGRMCREPVPEQLRTRIALAIQAEFRAVEGPGGGMQPF